MLDCHVFFLLLDNKRKGDVGLDNPASKTKKLDKCTDLIVMGLPWRTTEEEMRTHFESYGPLVLCTIKRDPKNGRSRGYGFIRFQEYGAQVMCLANRHFIDGRWCDVKIPDSRVSGAVCLSVVMILTVFVLIQTPFAVYTVTMLFANFQFVLSVMFVKLRKTECVVLNKVNVQAVKEVAQPVARTLKISNKLLKFSTTKNTIRE